MSNPRALNEADLAIVREWATTPRQKRKYNRAGLALRLGVSEHTITRAANGQSGYAPKATEAA
jgi:hypothetical protein